MRSIFITFCINIFLSILLLSAVGCKKKAPTPASPVGATQLDTAAAPTEVDRWTRFNNRIDTMETSMLQANNKLLELYELWVDLHPEERNRESLQQGTALDQLMRWTQTRRAQADGMDRGSGQGSLTDGIIDLLDQIVALERRIEEMNNITAFDEPYKVQRNDDTHLKFAIDYLMSKNIPPDRMPSILDRVALRNDLAIGFTIYFFYHRATNILYTSVYQGTASISPNNLTRIKIDSLRTMIELGQEYADSLKAQIALQDSLRRLMADSLRQALEDERIAREEAQRSEERASFLDSVQYVIYYTVVTKRELREAGLYGGGFLGFGKKLKMDQARSRLSFTESIYTRETNLIRIDGLEGTSNFRLYTISGQILKENLDYTFEWLSIPDERYVLRIELLRADLYKGNRMLIELR